MDSNGDPYSGFNDYDHAYDVDNVYEDAEFVRAIARSGHSRRPPTAKVEMNRSAATPAISRLQTALRTASRRGDVARPMTAVQAAGYTSANRKGTFDGIRAPSSNQTESPEEAIIKRIKHLETQTKELLVGSILASDENNLKAGLDKAKEAGRKEQQSKKLREQNSLPDNPDLSFSVQFTLASQYAANNMLNDALNVYQVILGEKRFENAKRLNVNVGNIFFRKKDYSNALKYYRMALDRVQKVNEKTRTKILNNIGVALIKLGRYEDALSAFEECLDNSGEYRAALNLILATYCLEDAEKMREAFQRLVDIPTMVDDDLHRNALSEPDLIVAQQLSNDKLKQWERRRKAEAERTIIVAARIISRQISPTFSEGYAWCVDTIKQSVYASLATELEMNKAVDFLKSGQMENAIESLTAFHNKENKIASAAANNLAMLNIISSKSNLSEATRFAENALSLDGYNANALVNRGNIYFLSGDPKSALQCYKEAIQVDPLCVAAIYNSGLVCRQIDDFDGAMSSFYKLNNMLVNNVQVLLQLASLYEGIEDRAQSIELYSQASSLSPTDPAILLKLAEIYDAEGDKSQAFQCNYDSYRYYPPNIDVIRWLGNYYIDAQFSEKAVRYFEKAAVMEFVQNKGKSNFRPNNVEWQLLVAGCQRRSGNFQKALDLYRQIHRRFPNNIECLRFLVQLCNDLRLPEKSEFENKLQKVERVNQLRIQRETDSGQTRRFGQTIQTGSLPPTTPSSRSLSAQTRAEIRTASANKNRSLLKGDEPYLITKKELSAEDLSFVDPIGPEPSRPKTGLNTAADPFDMNDLDEMLPE